MYFFCEPHMVCKIENILALCIMGLKKYASQIVYTQKTTFSQSMYKFLSNHVVILIV